MARRATLRPAVEESITEGLQPIQRAAHVVRIRPYSGRHPSNNAEPTVDDYVTGMADVMDGVRNVLHPAGVLFLNLGDT